ncbi:transglutaminase domain-containing protein [Methanobrevibacter sp.]|uniref:transglutaminase domain-containing protein n=3 Tax=Methanobrevibacter sp. TaxID=66852 RepID=UPI002634609A|nr:transglutaminase domain-containing protein [uncultured Methanobrevibacter sp.]
MEFFKKKFLFWGLLIFALILLSLTVVSAADYTVAGNSYDDIQDSVNGSTDNDRILLGTSTYTSSGNAIEIDGKNITIQGQSNSNRAKLDGRGLYRTIVVRNDASLTLRYIDFVNGTSISYHALNIRGSLLIENCSFKNCYGDSGSAIYVFEDSNSAIIRDCTFINNHAANTGDNSYTVGGAVISQGSDNFKVINCYFENNTALTYGGAIGLRNNGLGAEITNCTFVNNFAPDGGAIYVLASVTITGSTFKNNRASNNGGAIFTTGSNSLNISNSKFESNKAKTGGALYITVPTRINSSNFKSNVASNNGGGIYSTNSLNITGGIISGNGANYGSGIYNTGFLRLNKVSFINNKAKIFSIVVKAPNYVIKGDKLIVSSSLKSGDNLLNAIYTKNNNVNINGNSYTLSSSVSGKTVTLKINNKVFTSKTNSNGIAVFKISTSGVSTPSNVKFTASSSNNKGGKVNSSGNVKITKNSLKKELSNLSKKVVKPKSLTKQKISQLKKDLGTINQKISKTKWKKDKELKQTIKNINTALKNKKIDYFNTIKTTLKTINNTAKKVETFSTNKEKSNLLSQVNSTKKDIKKYYSSKKITKKQNTMLNNLASSVYKFVNNKKVQAHNDVSIVTWENGNKIETKWTNLVEDTNKKTTSKIYAKVTTKKEITVPCTTDYYKLENNNISADKVIYSHTINGSRTVFVNDTIKWVELSNNSLKEYYKWYYQENRTYKYYLGTKTVYKNGKLVSSTNGQSYLGTITKKLRDDWSMYVSPSEFCESDHVNITNLAKQIIANVTIKNDQNIANEILRWVQDNIEYELYGDTLYGALGTLNVKKGNCVDQAHLTIALLRAANIPAKYKSNKDISRGGHAWSYEFNNVINLIDGYLFGDKFVISHADLWWCGQPTANNSNHNFGYHYLGFDWCLLKPTSGYSIDSYNADFSKIEYMGGEWYHLNQQIILNGNIVTTWRLILG